MKRIVLYSTQPNTEPTVVEADVAQDCFLDIDDPDTPNRLCNIGASNKIAIPELEWLMKRDANSFRFYINYLGLLDSKKQIDVEKAKLITDFNTLERG